MTRSDYAAETFAKGYNCAQAVFAAFAEDMGMPEEEALRLTSALGGGFARTRNLCGAVNALGLVFGRLKGDETPEGNKAVYELTQRATAAFEGRYGSLSCGELLKNVKDLQRGGGPEKRTPAYYAARPCVALVVGAVEIAEELLELAPRE